MAAPVILFAEDLAQPPSDARPPGTPRNSTESEATPRQLVSQNLVNEDVVRSVRATRERPGSVSNWVSQQLLLPNLLLCDVPVRTAAAAPGVLITICPLFLLRKGQIVFCVLVSGFLPESI